MWKVLRLTLAVTLVQVALFAAAVTIAGTIVRSTKPGSTTEFATSFALGNILQVADLDTDLDTLYTLVDGQIDSQNIADDSITAADIAPSAVTSSELANNAVITAKILDGAVTRPKVTASPNVGFANCVDALSITTGEQGVASIAITTVAGSAVHIVCDCAISAFADAGAFIPNVTWRVTRDGTLIETKIYPIINSVSGIGAIKMPMPCPNVIDDGDTHTGVTAGAHTYFISAQTDSTHVAVTSPPGFAGRAYAAENLL